VQSFGINIIKFWRLRHSIGSDICHHQLSFIYNLWGEE
jgi:hypothetical protein